MAIEIIAGRQGPAYTSLSDYIYKHIGEAIKRGDEKQFLIVPDQYTLGAEEGLMAYNGLPGLMTAEVLSFKRLEYRVLSEVGGIAKKYIDDHGRGMLLQKCILDQREKLTVYKRSAKKIGFLDNIVQMIGELKKNDISPEHLCNLTEDDLLDKKLADIRIIYDAFETELGKDRVDSEDRTKLMIEALSKSEMVQEGSFYFDGFYNFTALEYQVIEALARVAKSLTFALPLDLDEHAADAQTFDLSRTITQKIGRIAKTHDIDMTVISIEKDKTVQSPLAHVEAEFYSYKPEIWTGDPEMVNKCMGIRQEQTPYQEIEACARKIVALVRDEGYRYCDIGVMVGDINVYSGDIRRVFSQYGLPTFMDENRRVTDNHFIESVLSLLEIIAGGYRFDDLFSYIKTGFAPVLPEEIEDLENYALEFGIRGKMWREEFSKISDNPDLDLESLNALRRRLIEPLYSFHQQFKTAKNFKEKTGVLIAFLEDIGVPEKLDAFVEEYTNQEDYAAAVVYRQIWNVLMEVLDQLSTVMKDASASITEYSRILTGGLNSYDVGVVPDVRDAIFVSDLLRSRGGGNKVLFILGMVEGQLPAATDNGELLTARERETMVNGGIPLIQDGQFKRRKQEAAFYRYLTSVSERLYLSYAMTNGEGGNLMPSSYIRRFFHLFPDLNEVIAQDRQNPWEMITTKEGTLGALAGHIRDKEEAEDSVLWLSVTDYYETTGSAGDSYQKILAAGHYQGVDDVINPARAKGVYNSATSMSVTELEQYRRCPYAHFVKYGLRPKRRKTYEIEALDTGNLLHLLMERVFSETAAQGVDLRTISEEAADKIVDNALRELLPAVNQGIFGSSAQYQNLGRKMGNIGKSSLKNLVHQLKEGLFQFERSEAMFDKIPVKGQSVYLKGYIDRIDVYRSTEKGFFKIIDYKSGSRDLKLTDIYYGLSLQLMVYLEGGEQLLSDEELIPGGAFYFHLDDPLVKVESMNPESIIKALTKNFKLKGIYLKDAEFVKAMDVDKSGIITTRGNNALTEPEMHSLRHYVEEKIAEMVKEILGGNIRIKPYKMGQEAGCTYCDYRCICQFDPSLGRAAYDILETSINREMIFERIGEKNDEMDS